MKLKDMVNLFDDKAMLGIIEVDEGRDLLGYGTETKDYIKNEIPELLDCYEVVALHHTRWEVWIHVKGCDYES